MVFKKLFRRNVDRIDDPIYNIVDVEASDLGDYSTGIDKMQSGEIDGFIIRNVMSKAELDTLIKSHDRIEDDKKYFSDTGMAVYPPPFSNLDKSSSTYRQELEQFFIDAGSRWDSFQSKFGFDFEGRIHEILSKICNGRKAETPIGVDGVGRYNPGCFKHLIPGEGLFKAHCGNLFHKEFPTFYEHMNEISIIENQMSYFVMLDPSQKGGELTMYDLLWKNAEVRMNGDTVLKDKEDEMHDLENKKQVKRQQLSPQAGDMIVFSGGRIWHKVELAEETRRLTCGGFLTRSRDNDSVYTWS